MMRGPFLLAVALLVGTAAQAAPQSAFPASPRPSVPPTARVHAGDASIAGQVMERDSERPLEGALIQLSSIDERVLMTQTGANGRYSFDGIAAGEYRLGVAHEGYVVDTPAAFETNLALRGAAAIVRVNEGQSRSDVHFKMTRVGVITGRVSTEDGKPLKGALVTLTMVTDSSFRSSAGWMARTNDDGEYTMPKVPEGLFQVRAMWNDPDPAMKSARLPNVYYPNTEKVQEAATVKVGPGQTLRGIDIVFPARNLLRIQGTIVRSNEAAPIEAFLLFGTTVQKVPVASDGSFSTPRLPMGHYTLVARARDDDRIEATWLTVDLASELTDMVLGLLPTGTIAGRLVTDDGTETPEALQIAAVLAEKGEEIDHYRRDRVDVGPGGAFELPGVFGERLLRLVGMTAGWRIDRVTIGRTPLTGSLTVDPGGRVDDVVIVLTRR